MAIYPQPNVGDPNWGAPLNAHMATLSDGAGGGINTSKTSTTTDGQIIQAADPANSILGDDGYTYVLNNKMMKTIGGVDTVILDGDAGSNWMRTIANDGFTPITNANEEFTVRDDGKTIINTDSSTTGTQLLVMDSTQAPSTGGRMAFRSYRSDGSEDWAGVGALEGMLAMSGQGNALANPHMVVDNTGNVGIGNTAPATDLHIFDDSGAAVTDNIVTIGEDYDLVALGLKNASTVTYADEKLSKIRISGHQAARSDIDFAHEGYAEYGFNGISLNGIQTGTAGTSGVGLRTHVSDGATPFSNNEGSLLKYPHHLPHVASYFHGSFVMRNRHNNAYVNAIALQSNGDIKFAQGVSHSDGNTSMIIKSGNVGIGTTSPTSKLSVVGLATHLDEVAATTAGLATGDFYVTPTGEIRMKL